LRGASVLRIDGDTPIAIAETNADGRYTLDGDGGRIVARVTSPIVGVWIHGAAEPDFALARGELVDIHIEFRGSEPFEWLDVKLTPRRDEVPPRVILAAGVTPGLVESMYSIRIVEPRLDVCVRPGLYDLRAYRFVDAAKGARPTNLIADHVMLDGEPAVPKFGGFEVELGRARKLAVALRPMKVEEM
jgi:hypothetical protein